MQATTNSVTAVGEPVENAAFIPRARRRSSSLIASSIEGPGAQFVDGGVVLELVGEQQVGRRIEDGAGTPSPTGEEM